MQHRVCVRSCRSLSFRFANELRVLTWNESESGAHAPNERRAHERRSEVERPFAERMRYRHETLDRHEREQQQRDLFNEMRLSCL